MEVDHYNYAIQLQQQHHHQKPRERGIEETDDENQEGITDQQEQSPRDVVSSWSVFYTE